MVAWGVPIAAAIGAASSLGGGFLNRGLSQRDAMQAQSEFALAQRREELHKSPSWEMRGLELAGINPMLPYAHGGPPNPSGFSPGIAQAINPGSDLASGVAAGASTALQMERTSADVERTFSEIDKIASEIDAIEANTALTEQQRLNAIAEQRRIFADEVLKIGQAVLNSEQLQNLAAHRAVLESEAAINRWRELSEQARSQLLQSGVPLAQADEDFYASWYGEFLRYVEKTTQSLGGIWGRRIGGPTDLID